MIERSVAEFAIAGCQTSWPAGDNLQRMRREVALAKERLPWVDMVVFAELVACDPLLAHAVSLPGPLEQAFCDIAKAHGVWLIPGSVYERSNGRIYNTTPIIDPSGQVVDRYRKIFPFRPYEEGVACGDRFVAFDVPGVGRFGVLICYDIWFPEAVRSLAWLGAEVILHPAMTNTVDRDVELAIVRASAAQNQCYIVNVNSAGGKHGNCGYGRSIVAGPEGEVIHEGGSSHEIITAIADLDRVRRSRRRGILALGQPLKSIRDTEARFPPYSAGVAHSEALEKLGPLVMPRDLREA